MTSEPIKPSLLDPEAAGGDNARGGFEFQDNLMLCRIPAWLAADGFTEMIYEALGDAEASFFVPGRGIVREFLEYKNHDLPPSEFWPEVEHFHEMDKGHPGVYHRFVLSCTDVSNPLKPLVRALNRLREAYPFYDSAPTVQDASYQAFERTVIRLGKSDELARFIFERVIIEAGQPRAEEVGFELFRANLERHLPEFSELGRSAAKAAWQALIALVRERKAKPIRRSELEAAIWSGLVPGKEPRRPIRIYTASEPLVGRWDLSAELSFDWVRFSGGGERAYPSQDEWDREVVGELAAARDWIVESERWRRIALTGQRRLSASLAIGAVFSAVRGFAIDLHYRDAVWATDAHPTPDIPAYPWQIGMPSGKARELAVVISIGRNAAPDVKAYLADESSTLPLLLLIGSEPILSAKHANMAVRSAKAAISEALGATGAGTLHLFLAVPAHIALFLGHRLNATGAVQCYEWVGTGIYQRACRLTLG